MDGGKNKAMVLTMHAFICTLKTIKTTLYRFRECPTAEGVLNWAAIFLHYPFKELK